MKTTLLLKYMSIFAYVLISNYSFGQVKTKIYDDGIPSNLLPVKLVPPNELSIKPPVEFDDLLKKSKIDAASIEYGNRFAVPRQVRINFLS